MSDLLGPLEVAPLYRTAPISPVAQPDFLNTVALARLGRGAPQVSSRPEALLSAAKRLERRAGRRDGVPSGPRPLDIDVLFFGDSVVAEEALIVPHPRLRQRRFVLAPLCDLQPELRLPPDGAVVRDLLAALGSGQRAEKVGWSAAAGGRPF